MKIEPLTQEHYDQLLANSQAMGNAMTGGDDQPEHFPVVKLFTPDAQCTWLLTEIDEDGRLFGLCDLGFGEPELGYVMLQEIQEASGKLGLPVEVDIHFRATKPLSEYAEQAYRDGEIMA